MILRDFIAKLSTRDMDAEVVTYNAEMGFFSSAYIYDTQIHDSDDWITLEGKERPKKIVLIG